MDVCACACVRARYRSLVGGERVFTKLRPVGKRTGYRRRRRRRRNTRLFRSNGTLLLFEISRASASSRSEC